MKSLSSRYFSDAIENLNESALKSESFDINLVQLFPNENTRMHSISTRSDMDVLSINLKCPPSDFNVK